MAARSLNEPQRSTKVGLRGPLARAEDQVLGAAAAGVGVAVVVVAAQGAGGGDQGVGDGGHGREGEGFTTGEAAGRSGDAHLPMSFFFGERCRPRKPR